MLRLIKITKKFIEPLLEDITFTLGNNERIGLVGLNGCGKSTLLKIISGVEVQDNGDIQIENEKIGYLPQEYNFEDERLVGEYIESLISYDLTKMFEIDILLEKLHATDLDFYQKISNLSPGEKMKLKLLEILYNNATILLLDEPTNHLDIEGILWFENFIKSFKGIVIVVSHDREFLNNICTNIFEIDKCKLLMFEGNYDDYLKSKNLYIDRLNQLFVVQEKKRKQLENLLSNSKKIKGGKARGKAVSAAKSRIKREITDKKINKYVDIKLSSFIIDGAVHSSKKVFELKNICFGYPNGKVLLQNYDLTMYGSEKLWIYGPNGIGKTTLIKILMGMIKPDSGEVIWGNNIKWEYFSQEQSHLDFEATVEDYFMRKTSIDWNRSFGVLEKFLFPKSMRRTQIKYLSPGQRARLSFAIFAQGDYNFLILDEPTNHIDISTKEVIENSLYEFKGGILVISHDRYFVRNIGITRTEGIG